ncbi:MAG TPA: YdeI/OmpD-associated family protein [Anaerolineales bacterium]|nr:YdeI/OmpD-associated family protein [Anaerolineales bacterium]
MLKPTGLPTLPFESKKKWVDWLAKHHDKSMGVWLKLGKKGTRIPSVTYEEALDVALCYGWIDGQKGSFDDKYWLQKFTPRGSKSIWSKINTEKVERLIKSGEMTPAGLKAIEAAKKDGRWEAAYASQKNISIPDDFQAALNTNKKAKAFFETLKSAERYSFLFRIQTAKKAETRAKRIQQFVEMLARNEKLHEFLVKKK